MLEATLLSIKQKVCDIDSNIDTPDKKNVRGTNFTMASCAIFICYCCFRFPQQRTMLRFDFEYRQQFAGS